MKPGFLGERVGTGGAVLSALDCAACFPLLASLAGYLGLGFLAAYAGLLINIPVPVFVVLVLISHAMVGLRARNFWRLLWGVVGPAMMLAVSLWNMLSPPGETCACGNRGRMVTTASGEA